MSACKKMIKFFGVIVLSVAGMSTAQAALITLTESFDEYGLAFDQLPTAGQLQTGFNWQFSGLAPAVGDLTLEINWERMDFEQENENMDLFADFSLLGNIGNAGQQSCVDAATPSGSLFEADCSGSTSFLASGALIDDSMLSIDALARGVHSSGGSSVGGEFGSPFGFISITLSYNTAEDPNTGEDPSTGEDPTTGEVSEPAVVALFGLGLLGLGFARRKARS